MHRRTFLAGAVAGASGAGLVGASGAAARAWLVPDVRSLGRVSFAQAGEDIVLYDLAHIVLKLQKPSYLDIGAADPVRGNNTYLLYSTGSRGVLVEPNPWYADRLRAARPGDVVLNVGIGVADESAAEYYVFRGRPQLNTFSRDEAARLQAGGKEQLERVVRMPLVSINRVIREQFNGAAPDILSIDVEGLDLAILRTLDFDRYRPGGICVETIRGRADVNPDIAAFLASRGYAARGGSLVNTIFVDPTRCS